MLSILIVGAFPPPGSERARNVFGGVLQSCRLLMQSSLPHRAQVTVVDSTQLSVPPPGLLVRSARAGWRALTFFFLYERNGPDTVLLFSASGASFLEKSFYAKYARARGSRVMFFLRDGGFLVQARRSSTYRRLAKACLRTCDVVLCQSSTWQRFFVAEMGLPEERCAILENWTVGERELTAGRERSYVPRSPLVVLFMGWIEETKGVFDLLEAFRRVCRESAQPSAKLVFAGGGTAVTACRDWVRTNGLDEHVQFAGWVEGDEKEELLRQADVFALPSHFEGLSNAMLEAMAAGLPVAVTRVGGLPDVVEDGRQGLLVEAGDVDALHQALRRLIADPGLRETLGRQAHLTATRFGVERAVTRLLELADGSRFAQPGDLVR